MKKGTRHFYAVLLAAIMLISGNLTLIATATDFGGSCGENLTWSFDETSKTLSITGTGSMADYTSTVNAPWYEYRLNIEAVSLSNGLADIGNYALNGCIRINTLAIPASVTSIGDYAFNNCYTLSTVTIPENLISIGKYSFYNCNSLLSVSIPATVTSIGSGAFTSCTMLSKVYITSLEKWCEINFNNSSSSNPLYLGADFYINGTKTTELVIPNTITQIPAYAFYGFASLKSVTIPEGITVINNYVFYGCKNLISVSLPQSLESIKDAVFCDCNKLSSINLPSTITTIGSRAFESCYLLSNIIIPPTITAISQSAFKNCRNLYSIIIPEGVKTIGSNAFEGCYNLTSVSLPMSLVTISSRAFTTCVALYEIANASALVLTAGTTTNGYIASNAKHIYNPASESSSIFTYGDFDFLVTSDTLYLIKYKGTNSAVTLPSEVTGNGETYTSYEVIGPSFAYNDRVTSITVPAAVSKIDGSSAFNNCSNIMEMCNLTGRTLESTEKCYTVKNVYTPPEGTSILTIASNCVFMKNGTTVSLILYTGTDSAVILPSEVTFGDVSYSSYEIASYAFYENSGITSVTFPQGVTKIGDYAFQFCTNLKSASLPTGIKILGTDAFSSTALENVTLPDSITTLSMRSFSNCTSLTDVTLPANITSVPRECFKGCTALTDIQIPSKVTTIDTYAFQKCTSLSEISIPTVKTIGSSAFESCYSLDEITLSENVTSLGTNAFQNCLSITEVDLPDTLTTVGNYAFTGCISLETVDLPDNSKSLGTYVFQNCYNLETVDIPTGVTSIGAYAFDNCYRLNEVTIPQGVKVINTYVFRNCGNISEINIPTDVTSIGNQAFYNCGSLSQINIPTGVTSIGSQAFYNCGSLSQVEIENVASWCAISFKDATSNPLNKGGVLMINEVPQTSITLPDSVTSISNYAFYGSGIEELIIGENSELASVSSNAFEGSDTLTVVCSIDSPAATAALESGANTQISGGVAVTNITLNSNSLQLNKGAYSTLTATVTPTDATNATVRFTSSNEAVATVTELGRVTAIAAGEAVITAAAVDGSGIKAICNVTVHEHSFGEWVPNNYGRHIRTCACGQTESAYCSYTAVVTPPTCTDRGFTTSTCSVCGYVKTGTYVSATGHTEQIIPAVAPTCTSIGYTEGKYCTVCNEILVAQQEVDMLEHTFTEWIVTEPATCFNDGSEYSLCDVCGYKETRSLSTLEHIPGEWITELAPTCSSEGSEVLYCTLCNTLLERRVMEKLPHAEYEWVVIRAASCSREGSEHYVCTECGFIENTRVIDKLPHTESDWGIGAYATCTENGLRRTFCTVCGLTLQTEDIPATGHNFGNWTASVEATCTSGGTLTRRCVICSAIETQATPKLEHTDENGDYHCDYCQEKMPNYNVISYILYIIKRILMSVTLLFSA